MKEAKGQRGAKGMKGAKGLSGSGKGGTSLGGFNCLDCVGLPTQSKGKQRGVKGEGK